MENQVKQYLARKKQWLLLQSEAKEKYKSYPMDRDSREHKGASVITLGKPLKNPSKKNTNRNIYMIKSGPDRDPDVYSFFKFLKVFHCPSYAT